MSNYFFQHSPLIMSRWGFLKHNLQNVSELTHALFMIEFVVEIEFTMENLSFQDNYADTEKYPLLMAL